MNRNANIESRCNCIYRNVVTVAF